MKNLLKYGNMLTELNNEIHEDIKSKTYDELLEIEGEARCATLINSSWRECKISKTVLEYVLYEKRLRQRERIIKRLESMKQNKKRFALL